LLKESDCYGGGATPVVYVLFFKKKIYRRMWALFHRADTSFHGCCIILCYAVCVMKRDNGWVQWLRESGSAAVCCSRIISRWWQFVRTVSSCGRSVYLSALARHSSHVGPPVSPLSQGYWSTASVKTITFCSTSTFLCLPDISLWCQKAFSS